MPYPRGKEITKEALFDFFDDLFTGRSGVGDNLKKDTLAAAAWPNQSVDRGWLQRKTHVGEDLLLTERATNRGYFQHPVRFSI